MRRLCLLLALTLAFTGAFARAEDFEASQAHVSGNLYYEIQGDGTAEITYWAGGAVSLEIPAELDGRAVTAIGDYALSYWDELERVGLPEGLVRIGDGAFEGCSRLRSIALPGSVTVLGKNPFAECADLKEIGLSGAEASFALVDGMLIDKSDERLVGYLGDAAACAVPDGTRIIGDYAFSGCATLKAVSLPEGIEAIREGAFQGCEGLEAVEMPKSVTVVGPLAFAYCTGLASVKLSAGIERIEAESFEGCARLGSIEIPEGVTSIGEYAFDGCENLGSVLLPSSLSAIGDEAFSRCAALRAIALPDAIAEMGANPFGDCRQLGEIAVSEDHDYLTVEDGVLFADGGDRLVCCPGALDAESYAIPDGTECVGDWAFFYCEGLTSVRIPDSVTSIADSAFDGGERLTLIVGRNSHAENYARENGMPYAYFDAGGRPDD